jgi:hypothetical protein
VATKKPKQPGSPQDVEAIRTQLTKALNAAADGGRKVGDAKRGVYIFYDYDGEPIYVGQTLEKLRTRIRRHLTNQRTDAVAMNVLDPFEVAEIEMWPFWDLEDDGKDVAQPILDDAEFTVYQLALENSRFNAVLNEKPVPQTKTITLPKSYRCRIIPDDLFPLRKHPDIRIARRASTIANLARVISERQVNAGLRETLLVQAQRLEWLARERLRELGGQLPDEDDEAPGDG